MKTTKTTTFHLRCEKCGWVYKGRRLKVCRQWSKSPLGTLGGVTWCRGKMVRVERKRMKTTGLRLLDQQIANAQTRLNDAITRIKRATTTVDKWQKTLARLNKKRTLLSTLAPGESTDRLITLEDA